MNTWKWEFDSIDERDEFMGEMFPDRRAQEEPGHFKVEQGTVVVFLTGVTYYGPQLAFPKLPLPLVQFKHEDEDHDGMAVGPAWLVEYLQTDGGTLSGTTAEMAEGNWIRKSDAIAYAREHGYALEEA